ncbi:MAG: hypothetical protein FD147_2241 [Chloroflexi bacterium]|nr:MAG: hypothetical protein FD147_2241 [Chloroflexota bacterium]
MIPAQIYCTAKQVMDDLHLRGFEDRADLMERIKAASDFIQRRAGNFIPITDVMKFGARPGHEYDPLYLSPLLSVTTLKNNGADVVDYALGPYNRMWPNGPYIVVEQDGAWGLEDNVEIAGTWGLYDSSAALGLTITQSTSSEITLVATNGSLLSPGMVVLIESEQELITAGAGGKGSPAGSSATSLLNGSITASDEEITVDNGAEFFQGEVIQIGVEDLFISKIGGNVLAVGRGWNGTAAAGHADDSSIKVYRTFSVIRGVNGTTAAAHSSKAVSQYVAPDTVNYLCRQIAALMRMKAESGFSGVTGNSEGGTGRYYSEFPPNQIDRVLNQFNVGE